ncbi:hypothetical protein EDD21DRAFT_441783 [Dissophora ornata]|nr:hypothetical protein EDD21DRAFT_441783 [Dissophora ornata]
MDSSDNVIINVSDDELEPSYSAVGPSCAVRSRRTRGAKPADSSNAPNQSTAEKPKTATAVWYFKDCSESDSPAEDDHPELEISQKDNYSMDLFKDFKPPFNARIAERVFKWRADISQLTQRFYSPVFGISFRDIDLKSLDSIVFYIGSNLGGTKAPRSPTEILTRQQLQAMPKSKNGVCNLKLHRQFEYSDYVITGKLFVTMEIRLSPDVSPESTQESLAMHYFALHECSEEGNPNDLPLYVHKPYLWSIDVQHKQTPADPGPARSVNIIRYSISGDGTHAATLSATDDYVYLDLWDISRTIDNTPVAPDVKERWQMAPYSPKWSAGIPMPFTRPNEESESCTDLTERVSYNNEYEMEKSFSTDASIAVSWDAAYVALFPTSSESFVKQLVVYECAGLQDHKDLKDQNQLSVTKSVIKSCKRLHDFHGEAKFHITDTKNPHEKNELFITCDNISVNIYKVYGEWTHIVEVPLCLGRRFGANGFWVEYPPFARILIDNLQGKYFTWFRNETQSFIWDIEASTLATVITGPQVDDESYATISSDGKMVAIHQGGTIMTYWTRSGSTLGTYKIPKKIHVSRLTFVQNDSLLLVDLCHKGHRTPGYVLDATTLSFVERFTYPGLYKREIEHNGAGPVGLYSRNGSKLDFIKLEDTVFDPNSSSTCRCGKLDWDDGAPPSTDRTYVSSSGLTFGFELLPPDDVDKPKARALSLKISEHGSQRELLRIPSILVDEMSERPSKCSYSAAFILGGLPRLLVHTDQFIMVWSLPTTYEGECILLQVQWIQRWRFRGSCQDPLSPVKGGIQCCKHQRQLLIPVTGTIGADVGHFKILVPLDRPAEGDRGFKFINGIMVAIDMCKSAGDPCKKAIIQYLKQHINSYHNPKVLVSCMIGEIIYSWKLDQHEACEELLTSLLTSKDTQWVPRLDYNQQTNPLFLLLENSKTESKYMNLAKIVVRYCITKARDDGDHHVMSLVTGCLPMLCDKKMLHFELGMDSLHKMAYLPVKNSSYVINNNITAQYLDIPWLLNKDDELLLQRHHNPIFQLQLSSTLLNDHKVNPAKNIFAARFDMLWEVEDSPITENQNPPVFEHISPLSKIWLHTLVFTIWHNIKPSHSIVRRHGLDINAFDNPAIEALIEYKWKVLGFNYWLVRFLLQCFYYLLVLTVVFMQVYQDQEAATPVYIAVLAFAGAFLWIELVQFLEGPRDYISSPYNFFDLVVFILPMSGSIRQLVSADGSVSIFSFSVLFVFLHLLFELRTNRNVCHYSTIILQVIGEIKVFFFIFAGGIVAFAIALLHLLHGCSTDTCKDSTTEFPKQPLAALSATYFFLGGIYDPISDDFSGGDWSFHLMMAFFLLFTVILMLNVLIALINTAFITGDETWHLLWLENRLFYIERAENMSYYIPNFRRRHNCFPKEIYYTGTQEQVKAYTDKYFPEDQLSNISSAITEAKSAITEAKSAITEVKSALVSSDTSRNGSVSNGNAQKQAIATTAVTAEGENSTQALARQVEELKIQMGEALSRLEKQIRNTKVSDSKDIHDPEGGHTGISRHAFTEDIFDTDDFEDVVANGSEQSHADIEEESNEEDEETKTSDCEKDSDPSENETEKKKNMKRKKVDDTDEEEEKFRFSRATVTYYLSAQCIIHTPVL